LVPFSVSGFNAKALNGVGFFELSEMVIFSGSKQELSLRNGG
jgi:hypothetical protein